MRYRVLLKYVLFGAFATVCAVAFSGNNLSGLAARCATPPSFPATVDDDVSSHAIQACETLADSGSADSHTYFHLGRLRYALGSKESAIDALVQSYRMGNPHAAAFIGWVVHSGRIDASPVSENVASLFDESARAGSAMGLYMLADYRYGLSSEQRMQLSDKEKIELEEIYFRLLEEAATQGFPLADYELGLAYRVDGIAVPSDRKKAIHYLH